MILVVDVGTTGLRAAIVQPDGSIASVEYRPFPPESPFPGLVEFDASRMAELVLEAANAVLERTDRGVIRAVGIANQRASTIIWDRSSGRPIAPALGWQDLRTVGECITARAEHGLRLAPNQSATKIGAILANAGGRDPSELCFGTVDTWVAWTLSGGSLHVTDHSNASVTGLYSPTMRTWDAHTCELLGVPLEMLPRIVDTSGMIGIAAALPGDLPITALVGDQQASLVGQGCVSPGRAKITFGTGGMLDVCTGSDRPANVSDRSPNGTFSIVAWSLGGTTTGGVEAIMLTAGTNVDWLRDDMGMIETAAESHAVASQCETADGVVYVPALFGLGTPHWDYGARGSLFGITRGTQRSHIVRAVLEGVAHRGADMVAAAEADTGLSIPTLRIDGGMSQNPTFVQALANATGKPVEVSPVVEATVLGAGLLAGVAVGIWSDLDDAATTWSPIGAVEPNGTLDREIWARAIGRTTAWIPELSALDF